MKFTATPDWLVGPANVKFCAVGTGNGAALAGDALMTVSPVRLRTAAAPTAPSRAHFDRKVCMRPSPPSDLPPQGENRRYALDGQARFALSDGSRSGQPIKDLCE